MHKAAWFALAFAAVAFGCASRVPARAGAGAGPPDVRWRHGYSYGRNRLGEPVTQHGSYARAWRRDASGA
jgi:hypothetical protein